jgi:AraC-like DNA-binding protein
LEQIHAQVLTGRVSIERAAQSMDTNVRTLQRELNRAGSDFRSLASAVRIRRAIELLRNTNGSIASVSAELGYSSPANFARAFRKVTGSGPREFRDRRNRRNRREYGFLPIMSVGGELEPSEDGGKLHCRDTHPQHC